MRTLVAAALVLGGMACGCGSRAPEPEAGGGAGRANAYVELPPVSPGCGSGALATVRARVTNAAVGDSWTDIVVRAQELEAKAGCDALLQRELERSVPTDNAARAVVVRGCAVEPLPPLPAPPVRAASASVLVTPRDDTLGWLLESPAPHVCYTSMSVGLSRYYSRRECDRVLARVRAKSGATPAEARARIDAELDGRVNELQAKVYDLCQGAIAATRRCADLEQRKQRLGADCERDRGAVCERAIEATQAWRACEDERAPKQAGCDLETRRLEILRGRKGAPIDAVRAHCRDE